MDQKLTVIVFKTHVDIGFTDLAENVLRRYSEKLLPLAVDVCEQTRALGEGRGYVWTLPSWVMKHCLESGQTPPGIRERAIDLIRSGQLIWHALPFTTHTEFCGLEEYARGLLISKNLSDAYGPRVISAKMTDVPGHTWMLPSILSAAGVKFFHLGSNPSVAAPDVPRLFWWEGPDGGRVLTFYSKGEYGSQLVPPDDWPYPVWLALMQTGDNLGPQNADDIKSILSDFAENSPGGKAVIGTLDSFYNELIKYPLNIPVIKKDLADTWIHGTGSYPKETAALRDLRGLMTETEKFASICAAMGLVGAEAAINAQNHLDKAFEQSLLYGEHTWGIDIKTSLGFDRRYDKKGFLAQKPDPRYVKTERSWEEQRERYRTAAKETGLAADALKQPDGMKNHMFNGLGWKRDGLPAFGYGAPGVPVETGAVACEAEKRVLENEWFRVEVDATAGSIRSLFEKKRNKEWVDQTDPRGFGYYRYDIYGDDDVTEFIRAYSYRFFDWSVNDLGRVGYPKQPHLTFYAKDYTVEAIRGGGSATLKLVSDIMWPSADEYGSARKTSLTVTLYADKPAIDLRYELIGKEETPMIEAGHFVFPLKLDYARVYLNKLGCVLDAGSDIASGANHALHCLEHFTDVTDGEAGMAILPRHTQLMSIGDQNILKYKPDYEKTAPTLFFNAFNNSYGTNFPQWTGGDLAFEFRLLPHGGDWKKGDIYRKAVEYRTPVTEAPAPGGLSGESLSWFEGLEGMEILAFKQSERRDGYILRLHDITGERHEVSFRLPELFSNSARCDLVENITDKLSGNTVSFVTEPFALHSFYLRKE